MSREELEEVMKLVKPQHFLPVHGEYAFLCAHAQLARDIGVRETSVIRNGHFLGISPRRNGATVSSGSMQLLGEARLRLFYNDGNRVRLPTRTCILIIFPITIWEDGTKFQLPQSLAGHMKLVKELCHREIAEI